MEATLSAQGAEGRRGEGGPAACSAKGPPKEAAGDSCAACWAQPRGGGAQPGGESKGRPGGGGEAVYRLADGRVGGRGRGVC